MHAARKQRERERERERDRDIHARCTHTKRDHGPVWQFLPYIGGVIFFFFFFLSGNKLEVINII
jgi:hypothetical protein